VNTNEKGRLEQGTLPGLFVFSDMIYGEKGEEKGGRRKSWGGVQGFDLFDRRCRVATTKGEGKEKMGKGRKHEKKEGEEGKKDPYHPSPCTSKAPGDQCTGKRKKEGRRKEKKVSCEKRKGKGRGKEGYSRAAKCLYIASRYLRSHTTKGGKEGGKQNAKREIISTVLRTNHHNLIDRSLRPQKKKKKKKRKREKKDFMGKKRKVRSQEPFTSIPARLPSVCAEKRKGEEKFMKKNGIPTPTGDKQKKREKRKTRGEVQGKGKKEGRVTT